MEPIPMNGAVSGRPPRSVWSRAKSASVLSMRPATLNENVWDAARATISPP